jgi:hypothetical protein
VGIYCSPSSRINHVANNKHHSRPSTARCNSRVELRMLSHCACFPSYFLPSFWTRRWFDGFSGAYIVLRRVRTIIHPKTRSPSRGTPLVGKVALPSLLCSKRYDVEEVVLYDVYVFIRRGNIDHYVKAMCNDTRVRVFTLEPDPCTYV